MTLLNSTLLDRYIGNVYLSLLGICMRQVSKLDVNCLVSLNKGGGGEGQKIA